MNHAANLEMKVAALEDENKMLARQLNEQIRDKHRILDEYAKAITRLKKERDEIAARLDNFMSSQGIPVA